MHSSLHDRYTRTRQWILKFQPNILPRCHSTSLTIGYRKNEFVLHDHIYEECNRANSNWILQNHSMILNQYRLYSQLRPGFPIYPLSSSMRKSWQTIQTRNLKHHQPSGSGSSLKSRTDSSTRTIHKAHVFCVVERRSNPNRDHGPCRGC